MSKKRRYYILSAICFAVLFAIYLSAYLPFMPKCNFFSNSEFCGSFFVFIIYGFYPLVACAFIFLVLGLLQKNATQSQDVQSPSLMQRSVSPFILLILGALLVFVPKFDRELGIDLFGTPFLFYLGGFVLLFAGFVNLIKRIEHK